MNVFLLVALKSMMGRGRETADSCISMLHLECTVVNTLQPCKNMTTESQISVELESDVNNICFL